MRDLVFLVTGAADGFGLQLCSRIAAEGRRVLATDLDNHRLEEAARVAAWPRDLVRLAPLDVRQPRDWAAAFDLGRRAFGGVDVLIHAAVPICARDVHGSDVDAATGNALLAAAERMLPRGGQVVVVAPGGAAAAARARCLAADASLRPQGLALTAVCTGPVEAIENGLALRAGASCPATGARVSADRVVELVLGRVLEARPRQAFLPMYAGWMVRLRELCSRERPALSTDPAPAQRA